MLIYTVVNYRNPKFPTRQTFNNLYSAAMFWEEFRLTSKVLDHQGKEIDPDLLWEILC